MIFKKWTSFYQPKLGRVFASWITLFFMIVYGSLLVIVTEIFNNRNNNNA